MKKLFVIGHPIEHSLSPAMQNAALKELKLDKEFYYDKRDVKPEELENFVKEIRNEEIFGANVTIPHKINIIPFLDKLTKEAELIQAVNTIYRENNQIIGHNTDGIGCLNTLKENNIQIEKKTILILGAGGAGRAISFTLALNNPKNLIIVDRSYEQAKSLTEEITKKTKTKTQPENLDNLNTILPNAEIIIHCTPTGMKNYAENQTLITSEHLNKNQTIMDIVYNPQKTKLLEEAEKAGCKTISGVGMLVHQGAVGFEIWTKNKAPINIMKEALLKQLN